MRVGSHSVVDFFGVSVVEGVSLCVFFSLSVSCDGVVDVSADLLENIRFSFDPLRARPPDPVPSVVTGVEGERGRSNCSLNVSQLLTSLFSFSRSWPPSVGVGDIGGLLAPSRFPIFFMKLK